MPPRTREGMKVVFCLFLVLFLGVADNQTLSPLLPAIRAQMGSSSSQVGLLFTGYALAAGLSVLAWGPLSDAYGRKRGLLTGLLVFGLGSIISLFSRTLAALLAGRIVTGMGASMLSLNTISYAADYFPYEQRGWAMGSIFSSYFAALILGVPIGSAVGEAFGWNVVFGLAFTSAVILLAAVGKLLPAHSLPTGRRISQLFLLGYIRIYAGFLKRHGSAGALASSFLASAGTMGFMAFVGIWLHDDFGVSGRQISLVFLASGAASLLASPFAGSLSDRLGKRSQFVVSSFALSFLLIILPRVAWGAILFAVVGSISLAAAFRQGPMEALITEVVPAQNRGSFVALKNSFSQLGIGVAATTSGILFESYGYLAVCLFCSVLTVLSALAMIAFVRQQHL